MENIPRFKISFIYVGVLLFLPMAKQDKISMPSSVGGIVRYMDESTSNISLQPIVIIYIIIAVVVVFGIVVPLL